MKNIHYKKIFWAIRALYYKPFLKKIEFPSYIGKPTFIEGFGRITIGKKNRIFPGVRIESKKSGEVEFGENVYIGQNVHITSEDSKLLIKDGSAIMANVCITNIDHNYEDVSLPVLEQGYSTKKTIIGSNCFIGHGAVIQAGVILGDHCIVGANSVVCRGSYESYSVLVGSPATLKRKFDFNKEVWESF